MTPQEYYDSLRRPGYWFKQINRLMNQYPAGGAPTNPGGPCPATSRVSVSVSVAFRQIMVAALRAGQFDLLAGQVAGETDEEVLAVTEQAEVGQADQELEDVHASHA